MNGESAGVSGVLKSWRRCSPFLMDAIPIYPTSIFAIASESTVIDCRAKYPTFC